MHTHEGEKKNYNKQYLESIMIYIELLLSLNIIKSIGIGVPYLKKSIGKDSIPSPTQNLCPKINTLFNPKINILLISKEEKIIHKVTKFNMRER